MVTQLFEESLCSPASCKRILPLVVLSSHTSPCECFAFRPCTVPEPCLGIFPSNESRSRIRADGLKEPLVVCHVNVPEKEGGTCT